MMLFGKDKGMETLRSVVAWRFKRRKTRIDWSTEGFQDPLCGINMVEKKPRMDSHAQTMDFE